jgi:DNA-binding transcriptional MerR regulator
MAAHPRDYMTIGELVESLQPAHPELTISKVRFLEEEELVNPERTPGGYRKFTSRDAARIDLVLRLQKEAFLPLSVIRERLADFDRGRVPEELKPLITRPEAVSLPFDENESIPLDEIQPALGFPATFVTELAGFGLVRIHQGEKGEEVKRVDVLIARACWDLRRFGVEPRHLRMYETAADREAALLAQLLMPGFRNRTPESRQKLAETLGELTRLTGDVKRLLLERSLSDVFEDVM